MLSIPDSTAVQYAVDLAKSLCSNPSLVIPPDEDGANDLADFIETLVQRFTNEAESEDAESAIEIVNDLEEHQ